MNFCPNCQRKGTPRDETNDREINALSLEYKREYGTAFGNLDVTNLINNPAANGKCRILALHLQEQAFGMLFDGLTSPNKAQYWCW